MNLKFELEGLFSNEAIELTLKNLPPLKTAVIDTLFPGHEEYTSATVPLSFFAESCQTAPLVRRGSRPISISSGEMENISITPRPISLSTNILAAELNDLRTILKDQYTKEQFVKRKIDVLRRITRLSSEAMSAVVATTGKLIWPSRLDGQGHEDFEIDFGEILSFAPTKKWDNPTLEIMEIYDQLEEISASIEENGGGSQIKFLAGKQAFNALSAIVRKWSSTVKDAPVDFKLKGQEIIVGDFEIRRLNERYLKPLSKNTYVPKIPEKVILAYAEDSPGLIVYAAIDSAKNSNKPTAFNIVVESLPGDVGFSLISQAKPLPARNPKSLLLAEVLD